MKLNRKMEYALIALKHMHSKTQNEVIGMPKLTSAKEVSEIYGCSFDVTSRVMQKLASRGVLQSVQGAQGGYKIARDLKQVSVYELNTVIMGEMEIAKCLDPAGGCELSTTCNIIMPVNRLNARMKKFFDSFTVSELLEGTASMTEGYEMADEMSDAESRV